MIFIYCNIKAAIVVTFYGSQESQMLMFFGCKWTRRQTMQRGQAGHQLRTDLAKFDSLVWLACSMVWQSAPAALLSSQRKNTPTWPSMSPVFARQTSVKKKKSILLCCVPTWLGSYSHTSTLIKSPPLATRGAAARKIDRSCLSLTAPHPALADVYRRNKCQC